MFVYLKERGRGKEGQGEGGREGETEGGKEEEIDGGRERFVIPLA